jgi:hypothetical protein
MRIVSPPMHTAWNWIGILTCLALWLSALATMCAAADAPEPFARPAQKAQLGCALGPTRVPEGTRRDACTLSLATDPQHRCRWSQAVVYPIYECRDGRWRCIDQCGASAPDPARTVRDVLPDTSVTSSSSRLCRETQNGFAEAASFLAMKGNRRRTRTH